MARKKKTVFKEKKKEPQEFEGYHLGDNVYAKLITGDQIGYGPINEFYPNTKEGPAFCFWDEINGGFRTTLVENIVKNPTGRMQGKLKRSRNKKK